MGNNSILMLFVIVPVLSLVLLGLNVLLSAHHPDESKISEFGCGFISVSGQTRTNFDIQFYLVAVLFLVFDLEIMLLLPYIMVLDQVSLFGF
jgi:NADH:ubiquinone oxidoreductase subunit 3 (subunit A)